MKREEEKTRKRSRRKAFDSLLEMKDSEPQKGHLWSPEGETKTHGVQARTRDPRKPEAAVMLKTLSAKKTDLHTDSWHCAERHFFVFSQSTSERSSVSRKDSEELSTEDCREKGRKVEGERRNKEKTLPSYQPSIAFYSTHDPPPPRHTQESHAIL